MKTAHYFSNKTLVIADSIQYATANREVYKVSGKKEARELARKLNATPWNF